MVVGRLVGRDSAKESFIIIMRLLPVLYDDALYIFLNKKTQDYSKSDITNYPFYYKAGQMCNYWNDSIDKKTYTKLFDWKLLESIHSGLIRYQPMLFTIYYTILTWKQREKAEMNNLYRLFERKHKYYL